MLAAACLARPAGAQTVLDWQTAVKRFEAYNPAIRAGLIGIDESRAAEITAYLRPNPNFTTSLDQLTPFTFNPYRPISGAFPLIVVDYLHERAHKRELRLDSARGATSIAESQQADLIRTLKFNLRSAFVQALQAKAVLAQARENLDYFDKELGIFRDRLKAGDIAQIDVKRMQLTRVQYESDLQTALVNLRTAKIQLQQLLLDRTPVEQFDVTGPFDFSDRLPPLADVRAEALEARPDLKAAVQTVEKARTDHKLAVANGSVDPTFAMDAARNPPYSVYVGFSINLPLRIFDRNQGEKLLTLLDISHARRPRPGRSAGLRGCRFGLRHPGQLGRTIEAISRQLSGDGSRCTRHHGVLVSERSGRARGLSRRATRLSRHHHCVSESGRKLSDRRGTVEYGGGERHRAVALWLNANPTSRRTCGVGQALPPGASACRPLSVCRAANGDPKTYRLNPNSCLKASSELYTIGQYVARSTNCHMRLAIDPWPRTMCGKRRQVSGRSS